MIFEIDLLDDDQIEYIITRLNDNSYVNGSVSNPSSVKNNLIHSTNSQYNSLHKYCHSIVNNKLYSLYLLKKISQIYFLRYEVGMKYGYHLDENPIAGVNAHYSMTCFLNDSKDYSGGELVLKIGNREIEYKLEAGKALLYPSGIWHKVNEVTDGKRDVFVCWLETVIKNSFMRNHLIEYGNFINSLEDDDTVEKLEYFRMNLMREYGDL